MLTGTIAGFSPCETELRSSQKKLKAKG